MARPKAKELTERELEVMHAFWENGEMTIGEVQQQLDDNARSLAYTTVATLVKILCEKKFLRQVGAGRPFSYRTKRTFSEVSGKLVKDMVQRVFGGSREALLVQLIGEQQLTPEEIAFLESIVKNSEDSSVTTKAESSTERSTGPQKKSSRG